MVHDFFGKPAIEQVMDRCLAVDANYRILATSEGVDDNVLADIAENKGWNVVRGSVEDVLSRFARAVRDYDLDIVVRVTGDCILIDYRLINYAISKFHELGTDYLALTNIIDGFDFEVIKGEAIVEADEKAKLPSEREHVSPYIRKSAKFKKELLPYGDRDLSHIHLSLDYREDAEVIESIIRNFEGKDYKYEEVVELIDENKQILERTKHIVPNEGYDKSMAVDKEFVTSLKGKALNLKKSKDLFNKVSTLIPNCSQTFSKSYLQFSAGASPLFAKEGKGCYLTDVDDNVYIDHAMGLGSCILGYSFAPVINDVEKQIGKGSTYTLPHYLEYELAELLTQVIPCAEMVRFGKNGSDVTSAAVKVARAFTGRDYVACSGYHGWQDWYISTTTKNRGIPGAVKELTRSFEYNNIESREKLFAKHKDKIACVIMEPISLAGPKDNFLQKVKELTEKNGALLIFDEVITGFRLANGGAQEYFGVVPDIACLGKAMGNGMPVSAVVGRKDIMELFNEVFFSFTFGGETLSIVSAIATIKYMIENRVIDYLWKQGEKLKEGIDNLINKKELNNILSLDSFPIRMILNFKGVEEDSLRMKTLFQQECAKRGVLFTGGLFMSLPHDDEIIGKSLSVYDEVMDILKYSIQYNMVDEMIEGRLLEPIFRKI
jgi:glutamate-1-semialdehyde 2,1-aminomutase/spore coat polysaccharide biosynthesis protein SpsF